MPRYVSPADIAEMKARGYEAATIEAAEEQAKRWHEAQAICRVIEEAFAGVKLGAGVGLSQARGLDDYEPESVLATLRARDEKEDWCRIPAEALNTFHSSLSFFDAEGMRFHLPAYLITDLNGEYGFGLTFTLIYDQRGDDPFVLLDSAQRRAVRAYLVFVAQGPDEQFYRAEIQRSLRDYWVEPPAEQDASHRF